MRCALLTACLVALSDAHGQPVNVVSPGGQASAEGNDANFYPFAAPPITRYQQAFGAGSLTALAGKQITQIAFRLDGSHTQTYAGGFQYQALRIRLSTSPQAVGALSTNMPANVGPDAVLVHSSGYTLPALSATGSPHPFDMIIDLEQPFIYHGGVLLMDIDGGLGPSLSSGLTFYLDAQNASSDAVARVYSTAAGSFGDSRGLVTRFTGVPVVCYPNCDGSTTPPVLGASDMVCFLDRFAAGSTYANCDGSTSPPILTINDMVCFLTRFSAGCG